MCYQTLLIQNTALNNSLVFYLEPLHDCPFIFLLCCRYFCGMYVNSTPQKNLYLAQNKIISPCKTSIYNYIHIISISFACISKGNAMRYNWLPVIIIFSSFWANTDPL